VTASGSLLVDKAAGWTSHDVVGRLRRVLGEKRIGHAGTLDPMATGLLVVAVGPVTRLLRFAQGEDKRYTGVIRLGASTATLDKDGVVTATAPVPTLTVDDVNAAAAAMCGESTQVPPMVSALKVDGRRLYEIAREGGEVERAPRPITVADFTLTPEGERQWRFTVTCSPGTYVRVLAADLAHRLGTLGHLVELRRTASGSHDVTNARTVAEVEAAVALGESVLSDPRELVAGLPHMEVSAEDAAALRHGRALVGGPGPSPSAVLDGAGALVGVVEFRADAWRPVVVLPVS
jgi:tRNA pseudouridine55 synthase